MIKVLIVEDHEIMRESLQMALEDEAGIEVCAAVADAADALEAAGSLELDLALIDVSLEDVSGIELVQRLKEQKPELFTLMLSGHGEAPYVERALAAGASGYILKGRSSEIPGAIRRVYNGQRYLSPALGRI